MIEGCDASDTGISNGRFRRLRMSLIGSDQTVSTDGSQADVTGDLGVLMPAMR